MSTVLHLSLDLEAVIVEELGRLEHESKAGTLDVPALARVLGRVEALMWVLEASEQHVADGREDVAPPRSAKRRRRTIQ